MAADEYTDDFQARLDRDHAALGGHEPPAPVKVLDPECRTCQLARVRETVGMVCRTCGTDYSPSVQIKGEVSESSLVYISREARRWVRWAL